MIPAPASFSSLGEHLRDHHYEPKNVVQCLLDYLAKPENREADGQYELDLMHQKYMYREIIKSFVEVLIPFVENPEDWDV